MSEPDDESLTGDVIERLRLHWPKVRVTAEFGESDFDSPTIVRVQIATDVYLDAFQGEATWMARPMVSASAAPSSGMDVQTGIIQVEGSRAYALGVLTSQGSELIADRFYEEVRYWWSRLHPGAAEGVLPPGDYSTQAE